MTVYILGINGSPRKYGNTFKLLSVTLKVAEKFNAKTEMIHLYDYKIKPCIGCLSDIQEACQYPCVLDDDIQEIYEKILEADGFIIATPVYWYSPSSQMKNFIDRITIFENMIFINGRCLLEGKVSGIIAVGNDSGTIQVISNLYATLNSMGVTIPPWAFAYYHGKGDVLNSRSAVLDAANIGRNVALMCNGIRPDEWYITDEFEGILNEIISQVRFEADENYKKQIPKRIKIISKLIGEVKTERLKTRIQSQQI